MAEEKKERFTVLTNTEALEKEKRKTSTPPPDSNYHTNPMYEKLLKFSEKQKKKRFTIEDLLKW